MKKLRNFSVLIMATAITLGLLSCKLDDDENNGKAKANYATPAANLPESVGTNELSGKTWKLSYYYGTFTDNLSFTEDTMKVKRVFGETFYRQGTYVSNSDTTVYKYTYDSENKVVYYSFLSCEHVSYDSAENPGVTYSYSSVNDFINYYDKQTHYTNEYWKQGDREYNLEQAKSAFTCVNSFCYNISESDQTLTISYTPCFLGSLPFRTYLENDIMSYTYETGAEGVHYVHGDVGSLYSRITDQYSMDNSIAVTKFNLKNKDENDSDLFSVLEFNGSSFTGKVFGWVHYKKDGFDGDILENFGTVEGTWTANKTGFEDFSVTFTFTNTSERVLENSKIELNKEYILSKQASSYKPEVILELVTE